LLALQDQLGVVEKPVFELRAEALARAEQTGGCRNRRGLGPHLDVLEPEYSVLVVRQSGDRCLK